jgi:transcriptional regulator with XRE-family HTH domain
MRSLVERELDSLRLGVQIAKLREHGRLSQTKLAALADMSAPKISAIENEPRNLTIGTLIRLAHALGSKVEIRFVPAKKAKSRGRKAKAA